MTDTDDADDAEGAQDAADGFALPDRDIVVFCGAGLSTASGIPDFRSPGGIWTRFDPMEFTIERFWEDPDRFWARRKRLTLESGILDARPNDGHLAIHHGIEAGRVASVITQNIDGLQAQAGTDPSHLVELHGNVHLSRCMGCDERTSTRGLLDGLPEVDVDGVAVPGSGFAAPRCGCGDVYKPDVVLFGEPVTRLQEAAERVAKAKALIVVGTSLQVYPAAGLVDLARARGLSIVIANRDETAYDGSVDLVVRGPVERTLPRLLA